LANIGVFIILARIFLAPLKKNLHCNIVYIVVIIMASNAGLLLFIPILNSLNIEELLNSEQKKTSKLYAYTRPPYKDKAIHY